MPDIKTALQRALAKTATDWAADDMAHQKIQSTQEKSMAQTPEKKDKRITNNVSRDTFYCVKDNPGKTATEITLLLVGRGHKLSSVTSLLSQMVRARMIMEDDRGGLTAVLKEYTPIQINGHKKRGAKFAETQRKKVVVVKRRAVDASATAPEPIIGGPAPATLSPLPTLPTAESVLASLSVAEAHKLYVELSKMFGGK